MTRFSHVSTTHRKSSVAKITDSSNNGRPLQKIGMKSNTSFTSIEECVPLTQQSPEPCGILLNGQSNGEVPNIESDNRKSEELQMTIKIVNIECESSDGIRKNTTSLDIQTLKNGQSVGESKLVNNNTSDSEFKDSDETTSFLGNDC